MTHFHSFLLFIWLKVFGARKGFDKAYQLYAYSRAPSQLAGWVPFLNVLVFIYGLYLLVVGTQAYYGLDQRRAALVYILPIIVIFLFVALGFGFLAANIAG